MSLTACVKGPNALCELKEVLGISGFTPYAKNLATFIFF